MPVKQILKTGNVPVKIYTDDIEAAALNQLAAMSQLPIIHAHIAAMPDVHCGIGATVGSVIPTRGAIIPAAVGVDIGCGMNALQLSLTANDLPLSLKSLRHEIETFVPVGFGMHALERARTQACQPFEHPLNEILDTHPDILKMLSKNKERWILQMGTLGSGNHFIEICLDERNHVWIMIHSGSRGIGNAIGRYFIALAKKDMQCHMKDLPQKDLAYLKEGTQYFHDYLKAVQWAQNYAFENRHQMMLLVLKALKKHLPHFKIINKAVNCHHNYVAYETHFGQEVYLTRKGAIRAGKNDLGIIPGSMGARSYIVKGKANPESFHSCAHGAGRRMSRTQAKKSFTAKDLIEQTQGVECRKDAQVIDEIPKAYKDIDQVMHNQTDLVEVLHTLKQVICVKG